MFLRLTAFSMLGYAVRTLNAYNCNYSTAAAATSAVDNVVGPIPNFEFEISTPRGLDVFRLHIFFQHLKLAFLEQTINTKWDVDNSSIMRRVATQIEAVSLQEKNIRSQLNLWQQENVRLDTMQKIIKGKTPGIQSCNYTFPDTSLEEFIHAGEHIALLSLGMSIGTSAIVAEYEPQALPFLTATTAINARYSTSLEFLRKNYVSELYDTKIDPLWAYHAAHQFVVPGSCPVALPFQASGDLESADTGNNTREFAWDGNYQSFAWEKRKPLFVGWTNQLNKPVYTALTVTGNGTGTSKVPQDLHGLVLAAVVSEE
jgi:hypothetical protein